MKIVICSGYFDPIHVGHIEYLKLAKSLGDRLIVILNSDKQAILKKGKYFMPENERKLILESLRYVDKVFMSIDEDKSVCLSICAVHDLFPNSEFIFAKGGDRFSFEVPEGPICKRLSISVVDGLGSKIQSSSALCS